MKVEAREIVAALDLAIEDQRRHVVELEEDYEAGYLDGLERALNIVYLKAHGVTTGAEAEQLDDGS
ncbi:MAG: hypothetical protein ACRDPV_11885 [Gaiellaceae bacterium]